VVSIQNAGNKLLTVLSRRVELLRKSCTSFDKLLLHRMNRRSEQDDNDDIDDECVQSYIQSAAVATVTAAFSWTVADTRANKRCVLAALSLDACCSCILRATRTAYTAYTATLQRIRQSRRRFQWMTQTSRGSQCEWLPNDYRRLSLNSPTKSHRVCWALRRQHCQNVSQRALSYHFPLQYDRSSSIPA